jgi:hypothetical protein
MIDEVFLGMAKADGVPCGMDDGQNLGVDDQPPSQPEFESEQVPKE